MAVAIRRSERKAASGVRRQIAFHGRLPWPIQIMNKLTPWTARRHLHLVRPDTNNDYTQAMVDGAEFPPLVVFWDGSDYWLADGFHRHSAMRAVAEVLR